MPTLLLKVAPLQNPSDYQALASVLTQLSTQHLGKHTEVTAVVIDDLPIARWYIDGQVPSGPTAWLEISVTEGTNTASQKASFISAAYSALQTLLGRGQALAPTSYVIVRELPATDWGYGGQTQAARRDARQASLPALAAVV